MNENQKAPVAVPSRHRLALLVLVFVYPVVTAVLYGMAALTQGWEGWERSLVMAPFMVALMVYVLIPFIQKRFRSFLLKR